MLNILSFLYLLIFLFFDSFMYVYSQGQLFLNLVALSHSLLSLAEIFLLNYFFPTSHVACVIPWVEQGLPAKREVIFRNIIKLLVASLLKKITPLPYIYHSLSIALWIGMKYH